MSLTFIDWLVMLVYFAFVFVVLLAGYGLVSDPQIYERSLGININLIWGATLAVFGAGLLLLARWRRSRL